MLTGQVYGGRQSQWLARHLLHDEVSDLVVVAFFRFFSFLFSRNILPFSPFLSEKGDAAATHACPDESTAPALCEDDADRVPRFFPIICSVENVGLLTVHVGLRSSHVGLISVRVQRTCGCASQSLGMVTPRPQVSALLLGQGV